MFCRYLTKLNIAMVAMIAMMRREMMVTVEAMAATAEPLSGLVGAAAIKQ